MTAKEFLTGVDRTFNYKTPDLDLLHCSIGLQTEIGELFESRNRTNLKEELGDIYWYLGAFCNWLIKNNKLNLEMDNSFNEVPQKVILMGNGLYLGEPLIIESGRFADYIKRYVFYGKEPDWLEVLNSGHRIWDLLGGYAYWEEFSIMDCLEANQAKLRKRYPEKFSEDKAINRDLDAETKALENHE